jgi:hypothetical protein
MEPEHESWRAPERVCHGQYSPAGHAGHSIAAADHLQSQARESVRCLPQRKLLRATTWEWREWHDPHALPAGTDVLEERSHDAEELQDQRQAKHPSIQIRAAGFNFLNHDLLSFAPSDSNLQLIYGPDGKVDNPNFGRAMNHYGQRIMEFGAKYSF